MMKDVMLSLSMTHNNSNNNNSNYTSFILYENCIDRKCPMSCFWTLYCVQRKNVNTNGETFTVRKVSNGVGVERIFPLLSPSLEKIEMVRKGSVRRAKLFYLRDKAGKGAKIKEDKTFLVAEKAAQ